MAESLSTPTAPAPAPDVSASSNGGPAPALTEAPSEATADAIYDEAFEAILGPNAPTTPPSGEPGGASTEGSEAETSPAGQPPAPAAQPASTPGPAGQLTADQVQVLQRSHMTPEMVSGWSQDQRDSYFSNALKREGDQTRSFQELRDQVKDLETRGASRKPAEDGADDEDGDNAPAASRAASDDQEATAASLAEEAARWTEELEDSFGEEIRPLGGMLNKIVGVTQKLEQQLATSAQASGAKDLLIVEMTIDQAVGGLVGDFPSLASPETRARVEARLQSDWAAEGNPHRTGTGPFLGRIKAAVRDAAQAVLGSTTEAAAQLNLVNKTKQRLRQQPLDGGSHGAKPAETMDEIYDQSYEQTIGADLRRA